MTTSAHTIRLVLGDQLDPHHSWFETVDHGVVHVLMEVRQETDYVLHHAQKILAIFAAMRDFADQLRAGGHRVRYVKLDDPSNRQSVTGNLEALAVHYHAQRMQWQRPDEWRLDKLLLDWSAHQPFACESVDTEHFLTDRDDLQRLMGHRKQWLMEHFYRHMRKTWNVLLDTRDEPEGGRWNYDHDNRNRWPGAPPEPEDWRPTHDHQELWEMAQRMGVKSFGNPQAAAVRWPVNRSEALDCLDAFIRTALPDFGSYEDALASQAPRLFHSLLSFALNVKMLRPLEVVQRAEEAYRSGEAPLAAVEGFVRQVMGWREYVRGIYWAHMPGYDDLNHLDHHTPLPHWFWSGDTRMNCLHLAITQSLETAHAHHIQRLMVIGNFSLLVGLDPKALHHWYLGIYIDAFEWVELPNTLGMSQRADGGVIATKSYVSSAAYINRMSDYCSGCVYDPAQKTGHHACPFNSLYWDFFARHADTFKDNRRLSMVYHQLHKMPDEQRAALQMQANQMRERIEAL